MSDSTHLGPRPTRPVRVQLEIHRAISDFYTVYDEQRDAVHQAVEADHSLEVPDEVRLLAGMSPTLERRAAFDDEWDPYIDHLRLLGALYADAGISFRSAHAYEFGWTWHIIPHLVKAYADSTERLTSALRGSHKFVEMTLPFLATAYHDQQALTVCRLASVVESTDDPVFSLGVEGRIRTWNPGAARVYGYALDDILGHTAERLWPAAQQGAGQLLFERVRGTRSVVRLDTEHATSNGRRLLVALTASPLLSEDEFIGVAVIARDVTESMKARIELQQLNRDLDQFVHIVSHDLRAPLSAIGNLAGWIEEDLPAAALQGEVAENLTLLRTRIDRMGILLNDLLDYSRLSRVSDAQGPVDTLSLAREVVDLIAIPPGFDVVVNESLPTLRAARVALEHIFMNLVANALDHHYADTGTIEIGATRSREEWIFSVRDDGPGIHPKHHADMFGMLRTMRSGREERGTGMGLAIVQRLVAAHGGRVWVESAPGDGATFFFTWPSDPDGA